MNGCGHRDGDEGGDESGGGDECGGKYREVSRFPIVDLVLYYQYWFSLSSVSIFVTLFLYCYSC